MLGRLACSGTWAAPFRATAWPRRTQPRGGRSAASGTSACCAGACQRHQPWLHQCPVVVGQCAGVCSRERSRVAQLSLRAALPDAADVEEEVQEGARRASQHERLCWRILEEEQSVCREQCLRPLGHKGVHEFPCQRALMPGPPPRPPPEPGDGEEEISAGSLRGAKHRCMCICGWLALGSGVREFQRRHPYRHEGEHECKRSHAGDITLGVAASAGRGSGASRRRWTSSGSVVAEVGVARGLQSWPGGAWRCWPSAGGSP